MKVAEVSAWVLAGAMGLGTFASALAASWTAGNLSKALSSTAATLFISGMILAFVAVALGAERGDD